MKKLVLPLLILGFIFASCQKEEVSSLTELDGVASKVKIEQEKSEDESCSEDGKCETAFGRYCDCASLNKCFSDFGFNRWGWSVELDKPGEYDFGFYAGAGQCDLSKGTPVGGVKVIFKDDGTVSVDDFYMKDGFVLKEFHFYAGDTEVPIGKNGKFTVAPGQYYNEGDTDGDGKVYVILHSVVCGDY